MLVQSFKSLHLPSLSLMNQKLKAHSRETNNKDTTLYFVFKQEGLNTKGIVRGVETAGNTSEQNDTNETKQKQHMGNRNQTIK